MKTHLTALALAGVALLFATREADAQVLVSAPTSSYASAPSASSTPYALYRPRAYVPYGTNDIFPYHGQAYGKPYDPWTWPYMSGAYQAGMARYYYPPVR